MSSNHGEADRVYRKALSGLSRGDLCAARIPSRTLLAAREAFSQIPRQTGRKKPIVGIVGEIFLRAHRFSNQRPGPED